MQNSGLRLSDTVCTAPLGPKVAGVNAQEASCCSNVVVFTCLRIVCSFLKRKQKYYSMGLHYQFEFYIVNLLSPVVYSLSYTMSMEIRAFVGVILPLYHQFYPTPSPLSQKVLPCLCSTFDKAVLSL